MSRLSWSPVPLLLAATLMVAGCGDAKDPVALVTTSHTAPALNLTTPLPTLPSLVMRALSLGGPGPTPARRETLLAGLGAWASADVVTDTVEAAQVRARAEAQVAGALADQLGPRRVAVSLENLDGLVRSGLSGALKMSNSGYLVTLLRDAESRLAQARAERAAGDPAGALQDMMAAADILERATPGPIAHRLVADAERALSAAPGTTTPASAPAVRADRERAVRLLRGAQEALQAGNYDLAIRRAFYAGELLGVR